MLECFAGLFHSHVKVYQKSHLQRQSRVDMNMRIWLFKIYLKFILVMRFYVVCFRLYV